MKEIQNIVNKYILDKEKRKKYLAILLVLSMLVSLAVSLSLIRPADSMTIATSPLAELLLDAKGAGISEALSSPPAGAVDFESKITSLTTSPTPLDGGSSNTVKGDFKVTYVFGTDSGVGTNDYNGGKQPYIYLWLPDNITVPADYAGGECKIYDYTTENEGWFSTPEGIAADGLAGYYSIDKESGLLVIMFTDEYLKYIEEHGGFEGSLTFEGEVQRANNADGNQTIQIGNESVEVAFDDADVTMEKTHSPSYPDGEMPIINWVIRINNPGHYTDLTGYTLTDSQFNSSLKTSPENIGTLNADTFTFDSNVKDCEYIELRYQKQLTAADLASGDFDNTVILHNPSDGDSTTNDLTDTETPQINTSTKATINKQGDPSYKVDGTLGYVQWEINVGRPYGLLLNGYTVQDDAFKKDGITYTITDGDGNDITSSVSIDKSTGVATINANVDSVKIVYRVPHTTNKTSAQNSASVTPPNGSTPDSDTGEKEAYYDDSNLFTVDKYDSSLNELTQSITWTIKIETTQDNAGTLNGYIISDDELSKLTNGLTSANVKTAKNNYNDVDKSTVTFIKNSDGSYTINGEVDSLEIEYTVPLSDAQLANRLEKGDNITNTVYVTPKDGDSSDKKSDSGKTWVGQLYNSFNKQLMSNNYESEKGSYEVDHPDYQVKELSWQVNMTQYTGFSNNKTFIDVMSATGNGDHYITPAQASNIIIQAASYDQNYVTLVEGTDYTITYYSDKEHTTAIEDFENSDTVAKSYAVTFLTPIDDKDYVHVKIGYKTTANVTNVSNGENSTFSNVASFGGATHNGSNYTFERIDPTIVPKIQVTLNKNWVKDDAELRPSSIKVQLQQLDEKGQWNDYGEAVTVTKEENYSYTWTDLPQRTNTADETPYYYRVKELDVDPAYDASWDENGTNNTGTLTITNTWKKVNVTVEKRWVGDTAAARPTSIIVKLQQRIGDSDEWNDVTDENDNPLPTQTLTKNEDGTFTTYTWKELPQEDENGEKIFYRAVEAETLANYVQTVTNVGTNTTNTVAITNTWQKLNLTVNKNWVGDTAADRPDSIQVKLQKKVGDGEWIDATVDDGVTELVKTLTKDSNGNFSTATWTELPRTDENGNSIYYRAYEITEGNEKLDKYSATHDNTGKNSTGTVSITNTYKYITISANKSWATANDEKASERPDSITFKLQEKVGNGNWTDADVTDFEKEIQNDGDGNFSAVSWSELPIVDGSGNSIYYRVVEDPVPDGYMASGWNDYGANSSTTFTITNTKKPPYSKSPATVVANTGGENGYGVTEKYELITSITPTDLANWTTKTVSINGVDTECYIFKWYVDLNKGNSYKFYDKLPDGSVLYDEAGYGLTLKYDYGSSCEMYYNKTSYYVYPYTYDGYDNCVYFTLNGATNVEYFTYCTAIPKSIVDNSITDNGFYELTNNIMTDTETEFNPSTLTIKPEAGMADGNLLSKGYIDKESNQNLAQPKYSLIVNPDGKTLSNDGTLDISDIFQITGYKEANGSRIDGSGLVDAVISYIQIEEIDADGNTIKTLTSDDYSYLIDTYDETVTDTKDLTEDYSNGSKYQYAVNGATWNNITLTNGGYFSNGLELILEVEGSAGKEVSPSISEFSNAKTGFTITAIDTVYNSSGKAKIKLVFTEDVSSSIQFRTQNTESTYIKLISAKVTETITTTKTNLNLTVPDSTRLKITYYYDLKTNAKTPSAIEPNSAIGERPPAGDTIYMKNEASLQTNSGMAVSNTSETSLEVHQAAGEVKAILYPKIQKVDVGNYSIDDLKATFKIAKYDTTDNTWKYATKFDEVYELKSDGTYSDKVVSHSLVYGEGCGETTDGYVPSVAADLVVDGSFTISFEDGVLYKLIEITEPEGYEDTGWVSVTETKVEDMEAYTFYFVYNGDEITLPEGLSKNIVRDLPQNGTLQIPNSQLIDIGASKTWSTIPSTASSVQLELWWSTTKISGVPTEPVAKKATAEDLGLSTLFSADYDLTSTTNENGEVVWYEAKIWENLPNGINGIPVYYYVKEVSYTIDGTTYVIEDDGSTNGDFKPTYSNNALNKDGIVSIMNSEGLVVSKKWQNSDNTDMNTNEIPAESINFELYGIIDGVQSKNPIYSGTIAPDANTGQWMIKIPDTVEISGYDSFKIYEVNNGSSLYNYTISDLYNIVGGSGVITLVNRSNIPTKTDVSIKKEWSDGYENHSSDSINIKLYQATRYLTTDELKGLSSMTPIIPSNVSEVSLENVESSVSLNSSNSWRAEWKNLPYKDGNGDQLYYYAIETAVPTGYEVSYSRLDTGSSQQVTISNSIPGSLTVNKLWVDESGNTITDGLPENVTLELYKRPKVTTTTSDNQNETETTTTATSSDSPIKIMAMGDSITHGYINNDHGYRKYMYDVLTKGGLNFDMVGNQGKDWDGADERTYTKSDGTTISYESAHEGFSMAWISDDESNTWNLLNIITGDSSTNPSSANTINTNDPDIILLLIGTNDIMNTYGDSLTKDVFVQRYKDLLIEIYNQDTDSDVEVIIMSPPPINSAKASGDSPATQQALMNTRISYCKSAIEDVVAYETQQGNKCTYLDLNSAFVNSTISLDELIYDYCHPSETGYELMGTFIAEYLLKRYGLSNDDGSTEETDENLQDISGLPEDFFTESGAVNTTVYEYVKDITITPKDGVWSTNVIGLTDDYLYYVKEKTVNGWEWSATYAHNGQLSESKEPIVVTNTKTIPKLSLTVKKTWIDGNDIENIRPDTLALTIQQSVDGTSWTNYSTITTNPEKNGNEWVYTVENLPAETGEGTKYYYKVVETVPDNYYLTTENNSITVDSEDTEIKLTNTKVFNLRINKLWSIDNHGVGSVSVRIYRSAIKSDAPDDIEIIQPDLEVISPTGDITMTVNTTTDVTVNKSGVTVTFENDSIASATVNGNTITVRGDNTGSTVMHITDGKTTVDVNVEVTAEPTLEISINDATIEAGSDTKITAAMTDSSSLSGITYSQSSTDGGEVEITVNSDGSATVKGKSEGTVKITATLNNKTSNEVTVTVELSDDFTLSASPSSTVSIGETITVSPSPTYGTFTYTSDSTSVATVDEKTGVVRGVSAGTATITATRSDGESRTIEITVTEVQILNQMVEVGLVNGEWLTVSIPEAYHDIEVEKLEAYFRDTLTEFPSHETHTNFYLNDLGNDVENSWTVDGRIATKGYKEDLSGSKSVGYRTFYTDEIEKIVVVYEDGSKFTIKNTNYVAEEQLTVTPTTVELTVGGESANLTSNKSLTMDNITYDSQYVNVSVNDKVITVQPVAEGTTPITVTVGDETQTVNVTVSAAASGGNEGGETVTEAFDISSNAATINIDSTKTVSKLVVSINKSSWHCVKVHFDDNNYLEAGWTSDNLGIMSYGYKYTNISAQVDSDNNLVITFMDGYQPSSVKLTKTNGSPTGSVIITYVTTSETAFSLRNTSLTLSDAGDTNVLADEENGELVSTVTLSASSSETAWQYIAENLPVYDESGAPYYYWIVEESVPGYTPSYSYSDNDDDAIDVDQCINAAEPGDDPTANVKNTKQDTTSSMPSTGGTGTTWYYYVGAVLMLLSGAGLIVLKRRHGSPR